MLAVSLLLAACAGRQPGSHFGSASASTQLSPSTTATASTPTAPSKSPTHRIVPAGGAYVTHVPLPAGCLTVGPAIVGVKVYLIQRALHLVGHRERYDSATQSAVRAFQASHALPVTGLVDAATWSAIGTGYPFCVDRYTQQPVVMPGAPPAVRIEAMITYATHRLGAPYMWGGAGPIGYDCSGLIIQAMYAGGRVVAGLTTDLHVQAGFRDTSYIYASELLHEPFAQRRRGDLVFYGSTLSHIAIYLGNGQIVEAVRPTIRIATLYADGLDAQPYVVRPFPS